MIDRRLMHVLFLSTLLIPTIGRAQVEEGDRGEDDSTSFVSVEGNASLSVEFYNDNRTSDTLLKLSELRRPPLLTRIDLSPTIHIGAVTLPLRFGFTIGGESKGSGLLDPANSLGISPGFNWEGGSLRLHLGSHRPEISRLVGSERQIFGGGCEAAIDSLEVRLSYGVVATAEEASSPEDPAQYRRTMGAGRISLGVGATRVGLNLLFAEDDTGSVGRGADLPHPTRNYVASLEGRTTIGRLAVDGEVAGSVHAGNIDDEPIDSGSIPDPAGEILEVADVDVYLSTTWGYAGRLRGVYRPTDLWSLGIEGELTSAAFRSEGRPYLQTNQLALTFTPQFRTGDGRLRLRGNMNVQLPDPFAHQWGARRLKGDITALWKEPFNLMNVNVTTGYRYHNLQTGSAPGFALNDTTGITPFDNETHPDSLLQFSVTRHTIILSPHYQFVAGGLYQTIGTQLSHTIGVNSRRIGGRRQSATSLTATYSLTPRTSPLRITSSLTTLLYNVEPSSIDSQPDTSLALSYTTLTGRLGIGYRLGRPGKNELTSHLTISHGGTIDGNAQAPTAGSHTSLTLLSRWRATGSTMVTFRLRKGWYRFTGEGWEEIVGRIGLEVGWR